MTMQVATDTAIAQAENWRESGVWNVTDTDTATAGELLTSLPWPTGPAAGSLGDRLDHLRGSLAALAVATATSRTPMGWFLGQCAAALAPILRWQPDGTAAHATITPAPDEITEAENAFARIHDFLATLLPHD
jgi:hypothetical protein